MPEHTEKFMTASTAMARHRSQGQQDNTSGAHKYISRNMMIATRHGGSGRAGYRREKSERETKVSKHGKPLGKRR